MADLPTIRMSVNSDKQQWSSSVVNCEAVLCYCQTSVIAGLRKIGHRVYVVHSNGTLSSRCSFRYGDDDLSPEMERTYNNAQN